MNNRRKEDPRLDEILEKITKIHDGYFGNGHKGLKVMVAQHWVYIKVLCGACSAIILYIGLGKLLKF
jgi:hypothetical protein